MRRKWLTIVFLGGCSLALAQSPKIKTDVEIEGEYLRAQSLFDKHNVAASLPLFEDLNAQRPNNPVYEERLAMAVMGASGGGTEQEITAANKRARSLLLSAKSHGDNSPLMTTLLEKFDEAEASKAPAQPRTPAQVDFFAAEKLFGAGDLKGAFTLYQKALAEDPALYVAALYAGDSAFKMGDCTQAGLYYSKAIAIDPDRETAYRYTADCLVKQGDMGKAEDMYIQAMLAQPYQKTPRQSLETWAGLNHKVVRAPAVSLPAGPSPTPGGKQGDITINIDPRKKAGDTSGDLMYSMTRALWQGDEFKKHFPAEKTYRHSLMEEAEAIRAILAVAPKKPGESTKTLQVLEKDGMLECWILFDDADQGIAQDYLAYRKDHRDLMAKYIAKYDVHPM